MTEADSMVQPSRRRGLGAVACVIAFMLSLVYLEASFANGYDFPLLFGGACGLLAAGLAFGLARGGRGWRTWSWRALGAAAALHVAVQAPRFAWLIGDFIK
jgi:hypothetical protein